MPNVPPLTCCCGVWGLPLLGTCIAWWPWLRSKGFGDWNACPLGSCIRRSWWNTWSLSSRADRSRPLWDARCPRWGCPCWIDWAVGCNARYEGSCWWRTESGSILQLVHGTRFSSPVVVDRCFMMGFIMLLDHQNIWLLLIGLRWVDTEVLNGLKLLITCFVLNLSVRYWWPAGADTWPVNQYFHAICSSYLIERSRSPVHFI
jgi:hypothetical protein